MSLGINTDNEVQLNHDTAPLLILMPDASLFHVPNAQRGIRDRRQAGAMPHTVAVFVTTQGFVLSNPVFCSSINITSGMSWKQAQNAGQ